MGSAALMLALLLSAQTPDAAGFVDLFNGKDLAGWEGLPGWWSVQDGAITAESTPETPCPRAHYLFWRGGEPGDFELVAEYRLRGGNSGIQFRSREIADFDLRGYQADCEAGDQWTGCLFEHARTGLAMRGEDVTIAPDGTRTVKPLGDPAALLKAVNKDGWNEYRIVARGPEITLAINGVTMCRLVDRQAGQAAARGVIALQMHPGPPMRIEFRKVRLKSLDPPAAR